MLIVTTPIAITALLVVRERLVAWLEQSKRWLLEAETAALVGHWRVDLVRGTIHWSDQAYRVHGIESGTPVEATTSLDHYCARRSKGAMPPSADRPTSRSALASPSTRASSICCTVPTRRCILPSAKRGTGCAWRPDAAAKLAGSIGAGRQIDPFGRGRMTRRDRSRPGHRQREAADDQCVEDQ